MDTLRQLTPAQRKQYGLLLCAAFCYFAGISFMLYLPRFVLHLGGDESHAGLLIGVSFVPVVLFTPIVGVFTDRLGGKIMLISGVVLAFGAYMGMSLVEQLDWRLYVLRFMQGTGHTLVFAPLLALVAHAIPPAVRMSAFAISSVVIQVGNVVGTAIAGWVIASVGYHEYFYGAAIFAVAALIPIFRINDVRWHDPGHKGKSLLSVAALPGIRQWLLLMLGLGGVYGVSLQFMPTYLLYLEQTGLIDNAIAPAWFVTSLIATVAMVRLLQARVLKAMPENVLIALCHVGVFCGVASLYWVRAEWQAVGAAILLGMAYGLLYPMITAYLFNAAPTSVKGRVSSLNAMIYESGFRGVPLVGGVVISQLGYAEMFVFLFAVYLVGIIWSLRKRSNDQTAST